MLEIFERRYLVSWLIFVKKDLQLSKHCINTRNALIELISGPNSPFNEDIKQQFSVKSGELLPDFFPLSANDTTQMVLFKKILNSLKNAEKGFVSIDEIDLSPERWGVGLIKEAIPTLITPINQIFDAVNDLNHLDPMVGSILDQAMAPFVSKAAYINHKITECRAKMDVGAHSLALPMGVDFGRSEDALVNLVGAIPKAVSIIGEMVHSSSDHEAFDLTSIDNELKSLKRTLSGSPNIIKHVNGMLSIARLLGQSTDQVLEKTPEIVNKVDALYKTFYSETLPQLMVEVTELEGALSLRPGVILDPLNEQVNKFETQLEKGLTGIKKSYNKVIAKKGVARTLLKATNIHLSEKRVLKAKLMPDKSSDKPVLQGLLQEKVVDIQNIRDKRAICLEKATEFFSLIGALQDEGWTDLSTVGLQDKVNFAEQLCYIKSDIVKNFGHGFIQALISSLQVTAVDIDSYLQEVGASSEVLERDLKSGKTTDPYLHSMMELGLCNSAVIEQVGRQQTWTAWGTGILQSVVEVVKGSSDAVFNRLAESATAKRLCSGIQHEINDLDQRITGYTNLATQRGITLTLETSAEVVEADLNVDEAIEKNTTLFQRIKKLNPAGKMSELIDLYHEKMNQHLDPGALEKIKSHIDEDGKPSLSCLYDDTTQMYLKGLDALQTIRMGLEGVETFHEYEDAEYTHEKMQFTVQFIKSLFVEIVPGIQSLASLKDNPALAEVIASFIDQKEVLEQLPFIGSGIASAMSGQSQPNHLKANFVDVWRKELDIVRSAELDLAEKLSVVDAKSVSPLSEEKESIAPSDEEAMMDKVTQLISHLKEESLLPKETEALSKLSQLISNPSSILFNTSSLRDINSGLAALLKLADVGTGNMASEASEVVSKLIENTVRTHDLALVNFGLNLEDNGIYNQLLVKMYEVQFDLTAKASGFAVAAQELSEAFDKRETRSHEGEIVKGWNQQINQYEQKLAALPGLIDEIADMENFTSEASKVALIDRYQLLQKDLYEIDGTFLVEPILRELQTWDDFYDLRNRVIDAEEKLEAYYESRIQNLNSKIKKLSDVSHVPILTSDLCEKIINVKREGYLASLRSLVSDEKVTECEALSSSELMDLIKDQKKQLLEEMGRCDLSELHAHPSNDRIKDLGRNIQNIMDFNVNKAKILSLDSDNPFKDSCYAMMDKISIECDDIQFLEKAIDKADLILSNTAHSLTYMRAKSWDIISKIETQNHPELKEECASLKEKLKQLGSTTVSPGKMILLLNQLNTLLHKAQTHTNGQGPQKMKVIRGLMNIVSAFISKLISNFVSNSLVDALSKAESKEKKAENIFEKVSDKLDAVIKTKGDDQLQQPENLSQKKQDSKFKS